MIFISFLGEGKRTWWTKRVGIAPNLDFVIRIDAPRSRGPRKSRFWQTNPIFLRGGQDFSFFGFSGLSVSSQLPLYFPRFKKEPCLGSSAGVIFEENQDFSDFAFPMLSASSRQAL